MLQWIDEIIREEDAGESDAEKQRSRDLLQVPGYMLCMRVWMLFGLALVCSAPTLAYVAIYLFLRTVGVIAR